MEKRLKLSIKPITEEVDGRMNVRDYQVQLGDWVLGRGVTSTQLIMDAGQKPRFIIECQPDVVDIEVYNVIAQVADPETTVTYTHTGARYDLIE